MKLSYRWHGLPGPTVEETLARLVLPQLVLELEDERVKETISAHLAETRGHSGRLKEA
jgi:ferritin-like metal-binding protein YciE